MEHTLRNWCATAFDTWQGATLTDYAHVVLAVVVLGWFVARYFSPK